jgi:hypothetical protein
MTADELIGLAIDDLAARVAAVEAELAELQLAGGPGGDGSRSPGTVAEPCYPTLERWVEEYFQPTFSRPIGGEFRWCWQWAEHAEAICRLEALWRSWEVLRLDPGLGMATWLTHHLDAQLPVLLGRSGPFAQCSPTRHGPTAAAAVP